MRRKPVVSALDVDRRSNRSAALREFDPRAVTWCAAVAAKKNEHPSRGGLSSSGRPGCSAGPGRKSQRRRSPEWPGRASRKVPPSRPGEDVRPPVACAGADRCRDGAHMAKATVSPNVSEPNQPVDSPWGYTESSAATQASAAQPAMGTTESHLTAGTRGSRAEADDAAAVVHRRCC